MFCFSDLEERIRFSINEYDVPAKQAKKIVQEKDMKRARFYEFHTNQKWGDAKNYSLLINTSKMSTDEVVEIIAALYDKKQDLLHLKELFRINILNTKALKYKKTGSINLIPGFFIDFISCKESRNIPQI